MKNVKTEESRRLTYEDLKMKLNKFGICAFLRPTGFGKTWTLAKLIKEESYNNVLYLYPSEVIKNTAAEAYANYVESAEESKELAETIRELKEIPNCTMMTYSKIARTKNEDMSEYSKYDLIIFDECHRLGGGKTKERVKKLMSLNKSAHFVGATATTNRTDGYDVIHEFFKDITVYPYTLHDAFQDELLLRPYYCYCSYDVETDLKEAAFMAGEDINNITVKEVLKSKMFEISNIINMPKIIKQVCNRYTKSKHLKFIVFLNKFSQLDEKKKEVINWFKDAFPSYTISDLTITSQTSETKNNVNRLDDLVYKKNHIDLVFSINILNMGYHVDDITGIIMYRCTSSDIIYTQQLGRVLSSSSSKHAIVFDVVDNLHRKALTSYDNSIKVNKSKNMMDNIDVDMTATVARIHNGDMEFLDSTIEDTNIISMSVDVDKEYRDDIIEEETDPDSTPEPWYYSMNKIEPGDLIATGHEATYRELIAKAVAEPMSQRCREAFECHFKKWCKYNNVPYPISDLELKRLYGLKKKDFVKEFQKIIEKNKIDYPMRDAQKLLEIGNKKKDGIPMEIFAKWKNVSVKSILELLEVE